jgi:trehalose 6-phosphate phosphatase
MKRVVAEPHLLASLAAPDTLLVFDFDGTLAPIVWDRHAARMRPSTHRWLARLCDAYTCAVVSGRARADVSGRLAGLALYDVIGNHGAAAAAAPGWSAEIASVIGSRVGVYPGVEIEDKGGSVAVHYRKSPHPLAALAAIEEVLRSLAAAARAISGNMVVDLLPPAAPGKGEAVLALRERTNAARVLYVGDDATDEEVFALAAPWLVSVRVGELPRSHAAYYVADQLEIDRLLELLVAHRSGAMVDPT